jgi:signal peptidase II
MVTHVEASRAPVARHGAYRRAGLLVAVVLILDQGTKQLVRGGIGIGDTERFLPGINLVHYRNTGVAYNIVSGGGPLVLVFTVVALAALLGYFVTRPAQPWLWLPTGLLIGGALGNLLDRVIDGAVTDFIKLPLWPAFNVADMSITIGVVALLWVLEGRRGAR